MNLDQLIEAERNAPAEPTPMQKRSVWTSIERSAIAAPLVLPAAAGKLSPLAKFGAALSTTTGKVVLATALVAGGTAGALNIPAPPKAAPPVVETEQPSSEAASRTKARAPRTKTAAVVSTPTPEAVQEASTVPIQRPKGKQPTQNPPKRSKIALIDPMGPPPEPVPPPPEPAEAQIDDSAGDIFLARAERALRKDKPEQALALLRVHRKAFPEGPSAERREAMFVRALCESDMSLAPKARFEFNRKWPKSKYRASLREICRLEHAQ